MSSQRIGSRGEILPEKNDGLPDSHRLGGLCPRCGKQSSFDILSTIPITLPHTKYISVQDIRRKGMQGLDQVSVLICRHCRQGISVIEEKWIGDKPAREGGSGTITYRGINWWPLTEADLSNDIPNDIAAAFNEATMCYSANCFRASAAMARRTLEAITVDQGETSGRLVDRLNTLSSKGILHPNLSDWATEVRLIGNIGAHFDLIDTVKEDDASDLLSFVLELLRYLYELPATITRRRS